MSTVRRPVCYPTSDGRPMAETDLHYDLMVHVRQYLDQWYVNEEDIYVSGNLLIYYVPGNKRRHVAPDVFVVKGVPRKKREYYLVWEEGKGPDVAIELTSSSTRKEDTSKKFVLYRDVLKVREYFLFDPCGDYLKPNMQGFRLTRGEYVPIVPVAQRLPSKVLGLHLERSGSDLRLYDPKTGLWLPTLEEKTQQEKVERLRADEERLRAVEERLRAETALLNSEKANQALRDEIAALKRKQTP